MLTIRVLGLRSKRYLAALGVANTYEGLSNAGALAFT
jgi:hypothetical protein